MTDELSKIDLDNIELSNIQIELQAICSSKETSATIESDDSSVTMSYDDQADIAANKQRQTVHCIDSTIEQLMTNGQKRPTPEELFSSVISTGSGANIRPFSTANYANDYPAMIEELSRASRITLNERNPHYADMAALLNNRFGVALSDIEIRPRRLGEACWDTNTQALQRYFKEQTDQTMEQNGELAFDNLYVEKSLDDMSQKEQTCRAPLLKYLIQESTVKEKDAMLTPDATPEMPETSPTKAPSRFG